MNLESTAASGPPTPPAPRRCRVSHGLAARCVAIAVFALASTGCASSVHQLQRAKALDKWQVEVVVGSALPIATNLYDAALDAIDTLEPRVKAANSGGSALTAAEARSLVRSSLTIVLFSPLPTTELSGRLGLGHGFDVGLRKSGPRTQLDGKWQALNAQKHGFDGALSLAVGRHSDPAASVLSSVSDIFDKLSLLDYSRTDLTVAALFSRDFGEVFAVTGALFWTRSWISVESKIDEALVQVGVQTSDLINAGPFQQIGGVAGLRVGYRYVWLTFELAVARIGFAPTILAQRVDLDGWLVSPALGLVGRF